MIKSLSILLATLCIVLGLLTVWTPLPTGVPLLAFGVVLLIATSRKFARYIRRQRKSIHWLNKVLHWVEEKSSGKFKKIIRRTRPRYFKNRQSKQRDIPPNSDPRSAL